MKVLTWAKITENKVGFKRCLKSVDTTNQIVSNIGKNKNTMPYLTTFPSDVFWFRDRSRGEGWVKLPHTCFFFSDREGWVKLPHTCFFFSDRELLLTWNLAHILSRLKTFEKVKNILINTNIFCTFTLLAF